MVSLGISKLTTAHIVFARGLLLMSRFALLAGLAGMVWVDAIPMRPTIPALILEDTNLALVVAFLRFEGSDFCL